jgi:hypothetical protein
MARPGKGPQPVGSFTFLFGPFIKLSQTWIKFWCNPNPARPALYLAHFSRPICRPTHGQAIVEWMLYETFYFMQLRFADLIWGTHACTSYQGKMAWRRLDVQHLQQSQLCISCILQQVLFCDLFLFECIDQSCHSLLSSTSMTSIELNLYGSSLYNERNSLAWLKIRIQQCIASLH